MHIGIITSPVPGHINPLCTIGRALKDRGHRVTVFGLLDTKKKILSEGLEFSSYGNDEFPTDCWEGHWIKMAKMTGIFVLLLTAKLHSLLAKMSTQK